MILPLLCHNRLLFLHLYMLYSAVAFKTWIILCKFGDMPLPYDPTPLPSYQLEHDLQVKLSTCELYASSYEQADRLGKGGYTNSPGKDRRVSNREVLTSSSMELPDCKGLYLGLDFQETLVISSPPSISSKSLCKASAISDIVGRARWSLSIHLSSSSCNVRICHVEGCISFHLIMSRPFEPFWDLLNEEPTLWGMTVSIRWDQADMIRSS